MSSAKTTQLPHLPEVERVSTSVIRILGGNPGRFTLQGTNTYLISPPNSTTRLLVDTGQGSNYPSWSAALRRTLTSESARLGRRVRVTQCVLSHWHHDHVGGVHELRRICSEMDGAIEGEGAKDSEGLEIEGEGKSVIERERERLKIYKYPLFDDTADSSPDDRDEKKSAETSITRRGREIERQLLRSANDDHDVGRIEDLEDGQILQVGSLPRSPDSEHKSLKLKVLHTPGHTSDHVALLITSSPTDAGEEGAIFTGDAVLGHGTAVFEDLAQYMSSLNKMNDAIASAAGASAGSSGDNQKGGNDAKEHSRSEGRGEVIIALPAHGAVITDARAKIEEYISHRAMREREVLDVLEGDRNPASAPPDKERSVKERQWTSMDIVKVVYADVPEPLHVAAEEGVVQVLKKLEGEDKVERTGIQLWRVRRTRKGGVTDDDDDDDQQVREKAAL